MNGTYFGSSGTSGSSGASSSSGTSGTSGLGTNGSAGTSGFDGTYFGSSGTSGTSGSSSSNGTSGTSAEGTNGTSGSSGLLNLTGTTDNGVVTYINSTGYGQVESNLTFNGSLLALTGAITSTTYRETYVDLGTGGNAILDLAAGNNFRRQFNSSGGIAFVNIPSGAFGFTLILVNAGAYSVNFPTIRWAGGTPPILTSSGTDVVVIYTYDGGTTYYGFLVGKNLS